MPRSLDIKQGTLAALVMAICCAALLFAAHPAQAVSCSGYGCDGKDPAETGCSSGAETVKTKSIERYSEPTGYEKVGTLELRYSPTCGTNWARVTFAFSGETHIEASIEREGKSSSLQKYEGYGHQVYGNMVYAPSPIKACASGGIYLNGSGFIKAGGLCG